MEVDQAEFTHEYEQPSNECQYENDDEDKDAEGEMRIDKDMRSASGSRVSGPSTYQIPSYSVAHTSGSSSTTSFGIRDPWRNAQDISSSAGPSRASSIPGNDGWYPTEPSESRKFEILYIPDPSRAMKKAEALNNLGWTAREITLLQYESIQHLKGLVYKNSITKDKAKVCITEWVSARFIVSRYSIV